MVKQPGTKLQKNSNYECYTKVLINKAVIFHTRDMSLGEIPELALKTRLLGSGEAKREEVRGFLSKGI